MRHRLKRYDELCYAWLFLREPTSLLRTLCGAVYPYKRSHGRVVPHGDILADADDVDAANLVVADFGQVDRHGPFQNARPVQRCGREHDAALETGPGLACDAQRL